MSPGERAGVPDVRGGRERGGGQRQAGGGGGEMSGARRSGYSKE